MAKIFEQLANQRAAMMEFRMKNGNHGARLLNILRRYDIAPAPKRSQTTTWKEFIRRHMDVLAGTYFFTVEVLTWRGLVTYYVLFFLHLESRRVSLAGITRHPVDNPDGSQRSGRRSGMSAPP
jgi:hypothetical protein